MELESQRRAALANYGVDAQLQHLLRTADLLDWSAANHVLDAIDRLLRAHHIIHTSREDLHRLRTLYARAGTRIERAGTSVNSIVVLRALLDREWDVNNPSSVYIPPLLAAVQMSDALAVQLLLALRPEIRDLPWGHQHITAIQLAEEWDDHAIISMLRAHAR